MSMPSGDSGALPTPPPPPPGWNAGTGSGDLAAMHSSGAAPTSNVFNHDPYREHFNSRQDSGAPGVKAPWLPPFRLGTGLPGLDTNDARDLINGRGTKSNVATNRAFENQGAGKAKGSNTGDEGNSGQSRGNQTGSGNRSNSRNNNQRGRQSDRPAQHGQSGVGKTSADYGTAGPAMPSSTVGGSGLLPAHTANHASTSAAPALAFAESQRRNTDPSKAISPPAGFTSWAQYCEVFVRSAFGLEPFPGGASAASVWRNAPTRDKHPGDPNPPAGVPVYWSGGSQGFGHTALSAGHGQVYSTDIDRSGAVSLVDINKITQKFGQKYEGWSESIGGKRVFEHPTTGATGGNDRQETGSTSPNIAGGTQSDARGGAKSIHSSTHAPTGASTVPVRAPTASNMPTSSTLPGAITTGHGPTHPFGITPSGPGGHYLKDEIKQLWIAAGGPADYADYAAAVAHAESGGNPRDHGTNTNGTQDWGLFQRNTVNGGSSADYDVEHNVKWAVQEFLKSGGGARGFNDWTDPAVEAYEKQHGVWHGREGYNYQGYKPGQDWSAY